jgi:hypothetical protein
MSLITAGTNSGAVPWHITAREAQVEEVHEKVKRQVLEGVRMPEGSSQGSPKDSSTRSSSGTTVKQIQSSISAIKAVTPMIAITTLSV